MRFVIIIYRVIARWCSDETKINYIISPGLILLHNACQAGGFVKGVFALDDPVYI